MGVGMPSGARPRRLVVAALVMAAALILAVDSRPDAPAAARAPLATAVPDTRPNVVLITVDDMRRDELAYMPYVRTLIGSRGFVFRNAFASFPLCCPARASMISGQLAHNHGSMGNSAQHRGGYAFFRDPNNTLAAWLQASGYRTGMVGRYLNHHDIIRGDEAVEVGWTHWRVPVQRQFRYHGQVYNLNGTLRTIPGHNTVVTTRLATNLMQPGRRPFFVWMNYFGPHTVYGGRHHTNPLPMPADASRRVVPLPRRNELDLSDKPWFYRQALTPLTPRLVRWIEARQTARARVLMGIDRMVRAMIRTLRDRRLLGDTVIIFNSDNGYSAGEHQIPGGKIMPYEPAVRIPLLMRGPGVPVGRTDRLVGLHDVAPTILHLAGTRGRRLIDGVSLLRVARRPDFARLRPMLIEHGPTLGSAFSRLDYAVPPGRRFLVGIRTRSFAYFRYAWGPEELYDMRFDPHQLSSVHARPRYQSIRRQLAARLETLKDCRGRACNRGFWLRR